MAKEAERLIIRNGTIAEFAAHVAGKTLYVYGAGNRAHAFFDRFPEKLIGVALKAVVDNDPVKRTVGVVLGGKALNAISGSDLVEQVAGRSDVVILLTMDSFWEPLRQMENNPAFDAASCYIVRLLEMEEYAPDLYGTGLPAGALREQGEFLIPPILHYCWFGRGEMPELAKKCMDSWQRYCPGFEIRLWNEDNYDVTKNTYMWEAYQAGKWAYVSDYVRVDVVNEYGGIYLDTDVELLQPLDALRREQAYAGYESETEVAFGLGFGSSANNPVLRDILELYTYLPWDGGKKPCPYYQSEVLAKKHGLRRDNSFQRLDCMTILPVRCLCAKSISSRREHRYPETFSVHHFAGSWTEFSAEESRFRELRGRAVYGDW